LGFLIFKLLRLLYGKNTLETGGEDDKITLETSGEPVQNTLETGGEDDEITLETSVFLVEPAGSLCGMFWVCFGV
jgi:hypothetical protein